MVIAQRPRARARGFFAKVLVESGGDGGAHLHEVEAELGDENELVPLEEAALDVARDVEGGELDDVGDPLRGERRGRRVGVLLLARFAVNKGGSRVEQERAIACVCVFCGVVVEMVVMRSC